MSCFIQTLEPLAFFCSDSEHFEAWGPVEVV